MNKEFIYLSDETFGVTDENGHITKQEFNKDILQQWDKENISEIIENITSTLNKLNDDKIEQKSVAFLSKYMFLGQILLLISSIVVAALIPTFANTMYIPITLPSVGAVFFKVTEKISKKKINALTSEIKKAENLIKDYKQQLDNVKTDSKKLVKEEFNVNEVVEIESGSIKYQDLEEELTNAYNEGYKEKVKSLSQNNKKRNK